MSPLLKLWNTLGGSGFGRWLVSKIVSFKAPYFKSISPVFDAIRPGYVEAHFKKRRKVENHIQTVHAIAMCNIAEWVGGSCMEVSLNPRFRWIPVGMEVQYLKLAKTDLRAVSELADFDWQEPGDVIIPVSVFDTNDVEVFHADIKMRISERSQ
jgi:acyl-coenzyme A thioesterase PaaI-like protein